MLREGLEDGCLPQCKDVSLNMTGGKAVVPKCKKIVAKQLMAEDARALGLSSINEFTNKINGYLNEKYNFNTLFLPLYNLNTTITTANGTIPNIPQININKYFTDFSGISTHVNQDILDNMLGDPEFKSTLVSLKYTFDNNNPTSQVKNKVIEQLDNYKEQRIKSPPDFSLIYDTFIQDMSKLYESLKSRCKNYYTDEILNSIVNDNSIYYGKNSSFHRLDNYINDAILGKLGEV